MQRLTQPARNKSLINFQGKQNPPNVHAYQKEDFDMKECTFTPKINRKSRYIDEKDELYCKEEGYTESQGPRYEMLYNKRLEYKQHKKEIKSILEDQREGKYAECTFQPEKFSKYNGFTMNDKMTIDERMEIWEKRKEEKLKEWRKNQDEKMVSGCTFTPKINPLNERVLKAYPQNIASSEFLRNGLQSYFQRKEHARKMIERTKVTQSKSVIQKGGYSYAKGHYDKTVGKNRNNVSINQAIISLHDDLHQINM